MRVSPAATAKIAQIKALASRWWSCHRAHPPPVAAWEWASALTRQLSTSFMSNGVRGRCLQCSLSVLSSGVSVCPWASIVEFLGYSRKREITLNPNLVRSIDVSRSIDVKDRCKIVPSYRYERSVGMFNSVCFVQHLFLYLFDLAKLRLQKD